MLPIKVPADSLPTLLVKPDVTIMERQINAALTTQIASNIVSRIPIASLAYLSSTGWLSSLLFVSGSISVSEIYMDHSSTSSNSSLTMVSASPSSSTLSASRIAF